MQVSKFQESTGYTPEKIISLLGYDATAWYRWTNGRGTPSAATQRLMDVIAWAKRINMDAVMLATLPDVPDLKWWRESHRWTQEYVAVTVLCVRKITWAQWEYNLRNVHPAVLRLVQCIEWLHRAKLLDLFLKSG